ncbi:MAG: hypothetical protein AAFQ94_02815 [Bacteroidota bacterium]
MDSKILIRSGASRQMNIHSWIAVIFFLTFTISCNTTKKVDKDLQQAFELHEKSMSIRNQVDGKVNTLFSDKDSIEVNGQVQYLDSIKMTLKNWDEQMIEVPGFEDEHDHAGHDHAGHDHDHDHNHDKVELTSKQHLEVQQHLFEEIQSIAGELDKLQ